MNRPGLISAGRRLAIMPSEHLDDWYVSYSPRNDNSTAEGPWEEWVELARRILEAEAKRSEGGLMSYDYDEQIRRLTEDPSRIRGEWFVGRGLLAFAPGCGSGCLTMIKSEPDSYCVPGRPDLTQAIVDDHRIPLDVSAIRAEHLPVFKEWQERLDRELRGHE